ncbi:universal stress protein [Conexibacter sp. CPCC 206217]|uniref:universal stress protein n=1 Tax=Conexibacter sp. CPCC 206217 TaxID=3064574 RepID=UPI002723D282|nr:universal stress protein [Conexibacter sp. CPCC 206217]MDO8212554.1 universal stress protein [Conexibacter sp. CPCC 206217]
MLRVIVTGVDGAEGGRDAAVLATALASADDPLVLLTGVWRESLLPLPLLLGPQVKPLEDVERTLLAVRDEYAPRAVTRPLSDLSPARALRRAAREEHADLLVLGSAPSAARGHARAGRDARQAIDDATCPVALAAHGLAHLPLVVRRIVVGIDGGPEADAALALASRLAASLGAHLKAVAVVDDKLPLRFGRFSEGLELLEWDELIARQRERADEVVARASQSDEVAAAEVRTGDPDAELAHAAADADLLVIGSRHWGRFSRVVIGSVAESLLRDAPCSLLLVPRPADESEKAR